MIRTLVPNNWGSVRLGLQTRSRGVNDGIVLTLTCTVRPTPGMRLLYTVEWVGPNGTMVESDGSRTVGEPTTQGTVQTLSLSFDPFDSSYGGRHTCRAVVSVPWMDIQPPIISSSYDLPVRSKYSCLKGIKHCMHKFVGMNVSITISYTPPDQYPDYSPPNYRAASSVTLTCVVSGAVGSSISYRWSSTCRSCFTSGSSSRSITTTFLRSRDAGVHTCTVTDGIEKVIAVIFEYIYIYIVIFEVMGQGECK